MTTLPLATPRTASAFAVFSGFFGQIRLLMRRAGARRQLLELDDRLLRDVGFSRADLAAGVL